MRKRWIIPVAAMMLASTTPLGAQAPATEFEGAAALGLTLRRLGTTPRVLMIAAHPDDENTAVLATLALGHGADVAYLSLTRGDGGQNGIGPEIGDALGVIRTEELLAARRLDGARQFFTRASDYGFSKSAEEAFLHWPKDSILGDVVAVVRAFRPDIIVPIFSGTPRDGHGQHQAAGILAREAFEVAADPSRYPEQVAAGLTPHRTSEMYQALWRGGGEGVRLAAGSLDPLLGRSHYQIAMASRSRHRSQDMGRPEEPGPQEYVLQRITPARGRAVVSAPAAGAAGSGGAAAHASAESLFQGIDTTLSALARSHDAPQAVRDALTAFDAAVASLRKTFNPLHPQAMVPGLVDALGHLDRAAAALDGGASASDLRFRIVQERQDAETALRLAARLQLDAITDDHRIVPGQDVRMIVRLWNGGNTPVAVSRMAPALPAGWTATRTGGAPTTRTLSAGDLLTDTFTVKVAANAAPTEPYFLELPRTSDLHRWPSDIRVGLPFEPPPLQAAARVQVAGALVSLQTEAMQRIVDLREGELRRSVLVVPAVSVRSSPRVAILPSGGAVASRTRASRGDRGSSAPAVGPRAVDVQVTLRSAAAVEGVLRFEVPQGWRVDRTDVPVSFSGPGEERTVAVAVSPPAGAAPGVYPVHARFAAGARSYDRGFEIIDYPHIRANALYAPATTQVRVLDVRLEPGLRVGFVRGAGDDAPEALSQMGATVEMIDSEMLARGDLDHFDAIVTGVRAYEVRPDLVAHNRRVLEYVERGGTLVVQYNKYEFDQGDFAPYPLAMRRPHDRVTDEAAPVTITDPANPVIAGPNRLGADDFEGWVQERGLYFPNTWDPRYRTMLSMADPGEDPLHGAIIETTYGKGTYVYTGLSLFRQIPEGVPGAYRLLANLVSLGRTKNDF